MLKAVKESVHRMTSHLQLINGYLELEDYGKALSLDSETSAPITETGLTEANWIYYPAW
jgi:hypothetical protein